MIDITFTTPTRNKTGRVDSFILFEDENIKIFYEYMNIHYHLEACRLTNMGATIAIDISKLVVELQSVPNT